MKIRSINPTDQDAAKQIILDGLGERWGWIDYSANPDLNDIAGTYGITNFFVACLEDKIVGTGGIIATGSTAQLVRISVVKEHRENGIGHAIVDMLVKHARKLGCSSVFLEATENWTGLVSFYHSCGFEITRRFDGEVRMEYQEL